MVRKATFLAFFLTAVCLGQELDNFKTAAAEAGMTFTLPAGFKTVSDNRFGLIMRNPEQTLELRYVVSPLAQEVAEYKRSPANKVDPNKVYSSLIMVAAANVSGQPPDPNVADHFPAEAVQAEFGADDGLTAFVPIADREFSKDYKYCVISIVQKNDVGYAIIYALANDQDAFKNVYFRDEVFHALRFK